MPIKIHLRWSVCIQCLPVEQPASPKHKCMCMRVYIYTINVAGSEYAPIHASAPSTRVLLGYREASINARKAKLRRLCERKRGGKLQVPLWLHQQWRDGDHGSMSLELQKCGWDKDMSCHLFLGSCIGFFHFMPLMACNHVGTIEGRFANGAM